MIELNVEAKKADLWTPIKSLEEFKKAREEGKKTAWWFGLGIDDYEIFSPTQSYTDQFMKTKLEKYKMCAHRTHRIVIKQGIIWEHPIQLNLDPQKYFKVMCFRSRLIMDNWLTANPHYQKYGDPSWQIIEDPQIAFG